MTVMVLLDFSKAFDTVNHVLLCRKLEKYNLEGSAINLLNSYLSERSQYVEDNEIESEKLPINNGVPQGSILGPLLFSIFINDIPNCVVHSLFHLYADDFQIYRSFLPVDGRKAVNELNNDLKRISEWSRTNGLQLNVRKTQSIVFRSKRSRHEHINSLPKVKLDNNELDYSSYVKNLGLYMDEHLDWKINTNAITKQVFYSLHSLNRMKYDTPKEIRLKLVKSLILPHFLYCDVVFSSSNSHIKNQLKLAFNACVRYVHNLKKFDHISQYVTCLLGMNLDSYHKYRLACFTYKCLHSMGPTYLDDFFKWGASERTKNIEHVKFHKSCYGQSLRAEGARVWDSLPMTAKSSVRFSSFKNVCLEFFKD